MSEISGSCPKPLMKKASYFVTQKIEYGLVASFSGTADTNYRVKCLVYPCEN